MAIHTHYRYNSKHNEDTTAFLLSQLKETEFSTPYTDSLMKRKNTYYCSIDRVNITLYSLIGAIHRYYESRRRGYNDSLPNRKTTVEQNKRNSQKTGFQKRVSN